MTPEQCFNIAGRRVRDGQPFCHPHDGRDCGHTYHEWMVTKPNGQTWVLVDGTTIPLHTEWALCPDHEEENR